MPIGPRSTALLFVLLVAVATASRLVPHAPNAAGVAAVALFAGFVFRSRLVALAAPLTAMLISDTVIGGYRPEVMAAVYGSFLAPALAGGWVRKADGALSTLARAAGCSLGSSILFFVTTNLAVWAFAGYYPVDSSGLAACFTAALPFFRFTLMGDMTYTMVLFGAAAIVPMVVSRLHAAGSACEVTAR